MSMNRPLTCEEYVEVVEKQIKRDKKRMHVFQVLAQVMESWDLKKVTTRVQKDLQEALGEQYRVSYFKDETWQTLSVRGIGNNPLVDENHIVIGYVTKQKSGIFNFQEWNHRDTYKNIRDHVAEMEDAIVSGELDKTIEEVNRLRRVILSHKKIVEMNRDLYHLLPEPANKMVREIGWLVGGELDA